MVLVFGAANRDPEIFEDPDAIRFDRGRNRHVAFGGGIHRCLGANLGRRELVVGLQEFMRVVPASSPTRSPTSRGTASAR